MRKMPMLNGGCFLKIYIAGNTGLPERERDVMKLVLHRLQSFFFVLPGQIQEKPWKVCLEMMNENIHCWSTGRRQSGRL